MMDDGQHPFVVLLTHAHSPLVISPDLDGLLQHEDRLRARRTTTKDHLPTTTKPSQDGFTSLPPPPPRRVGPRKAKPRPLLTRTEFIAPRSFTSPDVPSDCSSIDEFLDLSEGNPYLNPAPVLEPSLIIPFAVSPTGEIDITPIAERKEEDVVRAIYPPDLAVVQGDTTKARHDRSTNSSALPRSQPPESQRHSMSAVDRVLERARGALGQRKGRSPSSDRSRDRVDVGASSSSAAPVNVNGPRTVRPLISARASIYTSSPSHSPSSSPSPRSSISSSRRISISSTIYPPSSYAHDMDQAGLFRPDTPPAPPHVDELVRRAREASMSSTDQLREHRSSFIDLTSPTMPPQDTTEVAELRFDHVPGSPVSPIAFVDPSPPVLADHADAPLPASLSLPFRQSSRTPSRPHITRPASAGPLSRTQPGSPTSPQNRRPSLVLPPTTNLLNTQERAELVRKTQKLTKVFGQTPDAEVLAPRARASASAATNPVLAHLRAQRGHARGAVSMSVSPEQAPMPPVKAEWPPQEGTQYVTANGRRHSTPLSPSEFSFLEGTVSSPGSAPQTPTFEVTPTSEAASPSPWTASSSHHVRPPMTTPRASDATSSFMDFSDASDHDPDHDHDHEPEVVDDGASVLTVPTGPRRASSLRHSPSTTSIRELSATEQIEDERRRKRDKLAKLHRFLGSRVPTDLVLGPEMVGEPLPPAVDQRGGEEQGESDDEADKRKLWVRKRRSSSATGPLGRWSDEVDRMKEDLGEKEKAVNVKRALKMERMFGVAPPQTLYHTRQILPTPPSSFPSNLVVNALLPLTPLSPPVVQPASRNVNQSAYSKYNIKAQKRKSHRPGTGDSDKALLPFGGEGGMTRSDTRGSEGWEGDVYMHYRNSLNSLRDIIDRDDKQSLVELAEYLNSDAPASAGAATFRTPATPPDEFGGAASSSRAERRRSLPVRTSITSLRSEYSVATPAPEKTEFEKRRKKAAKLTQFFGVNYRELVGDILESIRRGVEDEVGKGTLLPEEVQDLIRNLETIRTKQDVMA